MNLEVQKKEKNFSKLEVEQGGPGGIAKMHEETSLKNSLKNFNKLI